MVGFPCFNDEVFPAWDSHDGKEALWSGEEQDKVPTKVFFDGLLLNFQVVISWVESQGPPNVVSPLPPTMEGSVLLQPTAVLCTRLNRDTPEVLV